MKKIVSSLSAALVLVAMALALFQPVPVRKVRAANINDRCDACLAKIQPKFDQCQAIHGVDYQSCYDDFNEDIVHCYAHFCEQ